MTKQELNRDIKRLFNKIQSLELGDNTPFFKFIGGEGKKEFTRLYYADTTAEYLTKDNLVRMINLNHRFRFIQFHTFYINAKI